MFTISQWGGHGSLYHEHPFVRSIHPSELLRYVSGHLFWSVLNDLQRILLSRPDWARKLMKISWRPWVWFGIDVVWIVFLRLWFLRPILDLNILNDRLDSVSSFAIFTVCLTCKLVLLKETDQMLFSLTFLYQVSAFRSSQELVSALRITVKRVKDIPKLLKVPAK